jgi:hypothetical protein
LSVREYERTRRVSLPADKAELSRNAFGMWADRTDINTDWVREGRARWESEWGNDQND